MVATPKQRENLIHWESELSKYEKELSAASDPFELEHWNHMAQYASHKILTIEDQIYGERKVILCVTAQPYNLN